MAGASNKKEELTPMMRQFYDVKDKYPDAIVLFRCGDFYETYCEDAIRASQILGITLTRRGKGAGDASKDRDAMAGFPFHALDTYLPKLVRAGLRVAICDQLEDPKLTKKLVKRGVTELVTPGVSYSDTILNNRENNFVCAIHFDKHLTGIAFLDISTGEFLCTEGTNDYVDKLLGSFAPKEVLFERTKRRLFEETFGNKFFTYELEDWMLTESSAHDRLNRQFGTKTLKGFGLQKYPRGIIAAGAILHYLDLTQHLQTGHITCLSRIEEDRYVWLDRFTVRNLELYGSQNEGAVNLLQVLDQTASPMGARLLKRWLAFPLKDVKPIRERQSVVEHFFRDPEMKALMEQQIAIIGDMERIISKVSVGRINPKEVVQLKYALTALMPIKQACLEADNDFLNQLGQRLDCCEEIRARIERQINNDPPTLVAKGNIIRAGVDPQLDEYRTLSTHGKDKLLEIQQREIETTGISSLKISYNNVFGYYIEVRNTYKEQVPEEWIRKQTLVNAERYITPELKEYETKILEAEKQIGIIETRLYNELVLALCDFVPQIQQDAAVVAQLDCLQSLARVAAANKYVCPQVTEDLTIDIRQGRHPVIEQQLPIGESYIANDVFLDNNSQQIIIITGPNMAGKSALLRQTALIVLLAQIGSFVPADAATIGVVDKIFTRVGASDNISLGESTFMVEMNEAAAILNNLSERSLVLFDELGRGTSTYDGISIAWAIVEYIHENKGHAKTLFATHYHELNDMEERFARIKNYNVSVKEADGRVIFLRKLVPGGSEHSFGIHVARLAGMPKSIVKNAERILAKLEKEAASAGPVRVKQDNGLQLSFIQLDDPVLEQIRDSLLQLDINNLTPMEALNKLNDIKHMIGSK